MLEASRICQLLQVRHVKDTPLIFIGQMWSDLVEWVRKHMVQGPIPLAGPEDIAIALCVASADEAIARLREHHKAWMAANKA